MLRFCMAVALSLFLLVSIGGSAMAASQEIGGIMYENVDPGEPFVQRPAAPQYWANPNPTPDELAAGLIAYVTSDPGDYEPKRQPKVTEHVQRLSASLTPGEQHAVWFGVWALEDLKGLQVAVESANTPLTVDVRHMHFWPQRTTWSGREWYMTPELLLPCANGKKTVPFRRGVLKEEDFDVNAWQSAGFWLTLTAASDARAGKYTATVSISSGGKAALHLPLEIDILPFKLREPSNKRWLLYCDQARWQNMSDEQILNELIDFRRHGFTGLIEISLATFDFAQLKDWGTPAINTDRYKKITTLCEKAGIPGPHIIWSHSLPERVAEALDIKVDLHKDEWPVELKDAIKATVKELVRLTKDDVPWYFYGPDEPSGDNTYALQVYECWSEAGAKTYATFYNAGFLNKALQHLNIPCFVASMLSNENDWNKFYQQCQLPGVEFSWYGTGCYVNPFPQERYMYHNRYGAGFFFRKTNAVSAVAWTLCRPHGDIFNDFDGVEQNKWEPKNQAFVYPHLLKEDDWSTHQGNIPTIAWESHREGRNDYLYINTLENLIKDKRSKGSKKAKSAANKSKAKLDALLNDLPFVNILGSQQFETKVLGNCRKEIAKMIIDLSKVK